MDMFTPSEIVYSALQIALFVAQKKDEEVAK